jgi:hypothetical protein
MIGLAMSACSFLLIFPDQRFALLLVRLDRLQVGVAIAGIIAYRASCVAFIKLLVGIINAANSQIGFNLIVSAGHLGKPIGGLDRIEFAVDINLLQLVDQDNRGIAINREVPRRNFYGEAVVRPITQVRQYFAGLGPALLKIGAIAWDRVQNVGRHGPHAFRRRQHGATNISLALSRRSYGRAPISGSGGYSDCRKEIRRD